MAFCLDFGRRERKFAVHKEQRETVFRHTTAYTVAASVQSFNNCADIITATNQALQARHTKASEKTKSNFEIQFEFCTRIEFLLLLFQFGECIQIKVER